MKQKLVFIFFYLFSLNFFGQNYNVVIQVNDETLLGGIVALSISNNDKQDEIRIFPQYYVGDLIIPEYRKDDFDNLNEKFLLSFNYYTYKSDEQKVKRFNVELTRSILEKEYLIINIYDFRNRKYKRRFQHLTNKDYLVQLICPSCSLYIGRK